MNPAASAVCTMTAAMPDSLRSRSPFSMRALAGHVDAPADSRPGREAAKSAPKSDVSLTREPHDIPVAPRKVVPLPEAGRQTVQLVVYGWANAQPGTLSWRFPSMRAAVRAAKTLRNASRWAVVADGAGESKPMQSERDVERARAAGTVLIEEG
jgi:hypothetical protein